MDDNLKPLPVNELLGKQFFIPHYQRGYRWTDLQVQQLMDDVDSFSPKEIPGKTSAKTFYCLQPIAVKLLDQDTKAKNNLEGEWYEVIDGQQRLTTIYILIQYINQKWLGEDKKAKFVLNYETRKGCVDFLENLKINSDDTVDIDKSNIDYFHISKALQAIRTWQIGYQKRKKKTFDQANFQSTFFNYSKMIWYEVTSRESSQALFERLNMGKISLTNAELTKALFLSSESFKELPVEERRIKQFEIARLWDDIEHKLNEKDSKFWSFITNKSRSGFDTKIELLLDMISGKQDGEKDPFYTFLNFANRQSDVSLSDIWEKVDQCYHTLLEWYMDKNFYHKIGYLVSARHFGQFSGVDLGELVAESMSKSKKKFSDQIDGLIRDSVKVELSELRYEQHYDQLFNVLLLFNVETIRASESISDFYPFKQHKDNQWSLEHIHARKTESFGKAKKEPWLEWLNLHLPILRERFENADTEEIKHKFNIAIQNVIRYNNDQLTWERFSGLFKEVNELLTIDAESMDRDSEGIGNLALLSQPDNAALNNGVFEAKRREIVRLDKKGSFIPICTKRVFIKYYNEEGIADQLCYWSESDREKYIAAIKDSLKVYLPANHIEEETDEN